VTEIERLTKMQEFAPRKESPPPPPAEHWPSDAELAAYIDGTLGKAESQRIAEHLADCEECFAVYMGTLQFQSEEGNVVPFPSSKGMQNTLWWYRIAAFLIIGVGAFGAYYSLFATPPTLETAELAAPVEGKAGIAESFWLGPTQRGGPEEEIENLPDYDALPIKMGVQIVNLRVSLEAGDGDNATNVVAHSLQALKNQGTGLDGSYEEITQAISGKGTPPRDLLPAASRLANDTREILGPAEVDLGQWVEAGRLAAIAEESSFFENSDNRAFLRRLLWRQKLGIGTKEFKLDPGALRSLQDISNLLQKGSLGRPEYARLRQSFEKILEIYYPKS
jgi:hypothetical protein